MHRATLVILCVVISRVLSHSWIACTDYRPQSQADVDHYNQSLCHAYARNWQNVGGSDAFGTDHGFNYQATETAPCRDPIGQPPDYGYSQQYPMATYTPGTTVCLAWPSKNHVAETCTNQYIPDTDLEIFAHGPNPTSDPTQTVFKSIVVTPALNGVHQTGTIDHKGFQNCSKFCENMDKSLCTGCFIVPNLQEGTVYTFQWYWIFNPGSAPYTTCWEAHISGHSAATSGSQSSSSSTSASTTSSSASTSGTSALVSSTSGSTSGSCQPNRDTVRITNVPNNLPLTGAFIVEFAFTTNQEDQVTVDILSTDSNPKWFGKGAANVTGSGTMSMAVIISDPNGLTAGTQYILRAWTVDSSKASDPAPWTFELDRNDMLVYSTKSNSSSFNNEVRSVESSGTILGAAFTWLVGILLFLLAFC